MSAILPKQFTQCLVVQLSCCSTDVTGVVETFNRIMSIAGERPFYGSAYMHVSSFNDSYWKECLLDIYWKECLLDSYWKECLLSYTLVHLNCPLSFEGSLHDGDTSCYFNSKLYKLRRRYCTAAKFHRSDHTIFEP